MRIKSGLDAVKNDPTPRKENRIKAHYTISDKVCFGLMILTALVQGAVTVSLITERNLLAFLK